MSDHPRVLNVGQCDFDHAGIVRMLSDNFDAFTDRAHSLDEALTAVETVHYDLVLVNRVFDADGSEGIELVRRLRTHEKTGTMPVMLVSGFTDAQDSAVALGARRGFGKDALDSKATVELLAPCLRR